MRMRWAVLGVLLGMLALLTTSCDTGPDTAVRAELRQQLGVRMRLFRRATVDLDDIQPLARQFYRERQFRPAWTTARGPTADAKDFVKLEIASREGLDPATLDREKLAAELERLDPGMLGKSASAKDLAAFDLRLTRTFLQVAAHLATGQVDPKKLPADWHLEQRKVDLNGALTRALQFHRVSETLESLPPRDPRYARLRDALARYRELAKLDPAPPLSAGRSLRRGQQGKRVGELRARLAANGDLQEPENALARFDAGTEAAVRRFQARHGLEPDGIVAEDDRAALNVPLARRVRQIELNLERWRWLPKPFEKDYLMVNIPDFSLQAIESNRPALSMRVVVGKQASRTPLFSDEVTHLVLNPTWNVPASIAGAEMLEQEQDDKDYLADHSFRVFDGTGPDAKELDPHDVHWSDYTPEDFPLAIRQDPGPTNPLGRIKFMCPNKFDVYLHDTPANQVFNAHARDFSHGCVRLEKPVELAVYLLRGTPGDDPESIELALETARDSTVRLPHPMPVHLLYWTAWVGDDGDVNFREDIYEHDRTLDRALGRSGAREMAALATSVDSRQVARVRP